MAKGSGGTRNSNSINNQVDKFIRWSPVLSQIPGHAETIAFLKKHGMPDVANGFSKYVQGLDLYYGDEIDKKAIIAFEKVLDKSTFKGEIYRGHSVHIEEIDSYIKKLKNKGISNKDISETPAFSFTKNRRIAEDYSYNAYEANNGEYIPVIFKYKGKAKGVDASKIMNYPEKEVILSRKNKFRIKSIRKTQIDDIYGYLVTLDI